MKKEVTIKPVSLGIKPTPLYKLDNLSQAYNTNIYIKRDDMIGVSLGGNKVRKLEYLLGDARAKGCDTVITTGAAQSNHVMLTLACASKLGMAGIGVLSNSGVKEFKGNLILDELFGGTIHFSNSRDQEEIMAEMTALAADLTKQDKRPYIIPMGGSNSLGVLGYVEAAEEIFAQGKEMGVTFNHIFSTVGSGGTYAGLVIGAGLHSPDTLVTGIEVSDAPFPEIVAQLITDTLPLLGTNDYPAEFKQRYISNVGKGYGVSDEHTVEAIKELAGLEGILLDPVYTGKTFSKMLDMIREGQFTSDDHILFLHTGGAGALFAVDMGLEF